jgi:hypothetical protein
MPPDTINTNQHYVPQMLLRGFSISADTEQVHVFDKRTDKTFVTTVRNIAAEHGYYDLGESATLDEAMTRADEVTFPIIERIRERQSLAAVSAVDRTCLAGFVVLQFLRTRGFQEGMRHIGQSFVEAIRERGLKPPEHWDASLTAERQRAHYLRVIPGFLKDFLPHLLVKDLLLFKTDGNTPFCISDNPVALNNTVNDGDGIRGTLGFAVPGIEVHLPISSELSLAYICPSVGATYEVLQKQLRSFGGLMSEDALYYLHGRDTGKAIKLKPENVRFHNSLQIRNAERFVISSRNEFADAADMTASDPEARVGPRVTTR